jgi:hypothetical protein
MACGPRHRADEPTPGDRSLCLPPLPGITPPSSSEVGARASAASARPESAGDSATRIGSGPGPRATRGAGEARSCRGSTAIAVLEFIVLNSTTKRKISICRAAPPCAYFLRRIALCASTPSSLRLMRLRIANSIISSMRSCGRRALPSRSTVSKTQMGDSPGYMTRRAIQLSFGSPKGQDMPEAAG